MCSKFFDDVDKRLGQDLREFRKPGLTGTYAKTNGAPMADTVRLSAPLRTMHGIRPVCSHDLNTCLDTVGHMRIATIRHAKNAGGHRGRSAWGT